MHLSTLARKAIHAAARFARVDVYRCLTLPWAAASQSRRPPAPDMVIRPLDHAALDLHARDPSQEISRQFLASLAGRADLCLGAFKADELVAYCFFSLKPTAIDAYLRFGYPPGWVYAYKAFTRPEWRGRRLLAAIIASARGFRWEGLRTQPRGFVTLALTRNRPSLQAFDKAGFRASADIPVLVLRKRPRAVLQRNHSSGFVIERS